MSEYIRRGECLEAVAKVNSVLTRFEERIRQIQKDMNKLKAENRALKDKVQILASWREIVGGVVAKHTDRIQTLENKNEAFEARTRGWEEGFGASVRESLKRMEARIDRLLVSDDSGEFQIKLWVDELRKLKGQVKRLDASVFELFDRVPPRPKGELSRYLDESIKKVVNGG